MEDTFRQLSGVDKDKRKHCRNQGSDKWQKAQVVETRKLDKENVTDKLSNAKIYITNANYLSLGAPSKVVAKDASGKPVRNGKWTTSDKEASVEDNHDGTALITATKSGTMEITYTVGSNKTTKTVTVK